MVIQHNLGAMNANRMLGTISGNQAKLSERLSSGYKINRAGDDAAGLKISEKMRSQIRGLTQASANAQDGVSLIQTAEGALNEAHSILQRMNELTIQGANDTNESIDRDAINEELTALTTELDRIATTTEFNKQQLLNGSFTNKKLQVGANTNQKIEIEIGKMNASAIGLRACVTVKYSTKLYSTADTGLTSRADTTLAACLANGATITGSDYSITKSDTVTNPTVGDYEKAQATLSKIQIAINNISSQRSALGALQNRLEHTIANLDNVAENTQAAESRIRDTDMASTMVEYSKNNILTQAGQSMLAQANQSNQGILSLLQ